MRIALGLEYDGGAFCGWQTQPSGCGVQDHLQAALSRFVDSPVEVIAAGRTDTGVHATAQVVHFDSPVQRDAYSWVRGTNSYADPHLRVLWAAATGGDSGVPDNVRAIVLFYRECADLLRAAGAEHGNALVINMASIAGKSPQPWLSVYSATKAAVAAYSVSMNKEFAKFGVKSVAFAPGFVDTDMTDYVKDKVPAEEMLRTSDIAEGLRFVLRVSPTCLVPEIVFQRPQEIA